MEKISVKGFKKLALCFSDNLAERRYHIYSICRSQNAWVLRLRLLQIRILREKLSYFKKKKYLNPIESSKVIQF